MIEVMKQRKIHVVVIRVLISRLYGTLGVHTLKQSLQL
jgi:hypothetical protein